MKSCNFGMMKIFLFILTFLISSVFFAQAVDKIPSDSTYIYKGYHFYKGDSLVIELPEVKLLKKLQFQNEYDRRYYYWFRKKTLKAYPYAKLAGATLQKLNDSLAQIPSNRKRKKYVKHMQDYMEREFEGQLKKMTRTEGRILIKLIHRQTGLTVYDLVKEYRSGWKAFWYNNTAKLFKLSLDSEYDPENVPEDFMIEDILQRAFTYGILEAQSSKLDFDYYQMANEKYKSIHVDKVK